MDIWHFVEITAAGQPILRDTEKDILLDHKIGLYHGKSKIIDRQSGRVFLTSERIIYVDDFEPTKNSLVIELEDVERIEYSSKFLKKSSKLILFYDDKSELGKRKEDKRKGTVSTGWVCPICMFSNETPGKFDKTTNPLPICENCGVPADYELTKSSITASNDNIGSTKETANVCPACTFVNHAQLRNCEICGSRLPNVKKRRSQKDDYIDTRLNIQLENEDLNKNLEKVNFVQLSFKKSDGILFSQATEKTLEDFKRAKKFHIFNKNLASKNGIKVGGTLNDLPLLETTDKKFGIMSLENYRETQLLNNDILLSNALSDLNNLMSLAPDIEKLYSKHRKLDTGKNEKHRPVLMTDREKFYNKSMFLDQIAREIYEFTTTEFKADGTRSNIILVTLIDMYAMYNKAMRIGIGFISPEEMKEACQRFESLGLKNLQLMKLNGRVLCLSSGDSFAQMKKAVLDIIELHPGSDLLQLTQQLNNEFENISTVGILTEVLQNCIDGGDIVIDEQLSGILHYKNEFWPIIEEVALKS